MIRLLHWRSGIVLCCLVGLTGCASPKLYERHVEPAYDATGHPRPGYATLNVEFLDALNLDLEACYRDARRP
jgi:hypothetical protein